MDSVSMTDKVETKEETKARKKKEYAAKYYQENKDKIKAKVKSWEIENKEHIKKRDAEYFQKNKESIKEKRNLKIKTEKQIEADKANKRKWAEANKEKIRQSRLERRDEINAKRKADYPNKREKILQDIKERRLKNIEKEKEKDRIRNAKRAKYCREKIKNWRKKNPDAYRANTARRRARKLKAEGFYESKDIELIFEKQSGKCAVCFVKLKGKNYHVDHVQPISKGGSNWPSNLQLTCAPCNLKKNAKDPLVFARELVRLL